MIDKKSIMEEIGLLATDLDGTLLGQKPELALYNSFRDKLAALRDRGSYWAICTGRSLRSYRRVILPMRAFGIRPDYVITRHAYIFSESRYFLGYKPHIIWNLRVKALQWRHSYMVRRAIPRLRKTMKGRFPFAKLMALGPERVCFSFEASELAHAAADMMRQATRRYDYLRVFEYRNQVDVRSVPFTKGLALAELAHHLSVSPEHILAIGDGQNDTSMMERQVARHVACPSNAEPEVMAIVHKSGGHIAKSRYLEGVMEAFTAYESGDIQSDLPETWKDPTDLENPVKARTPRPRAGAEQSSGALRGAVIFLAAIYTILLVFANFGLLPGPIGGLVLKPFNLLLALIRKVIPAALAH